MNRTQRRQQQKYYKRQLKKDKRKQMNNLMQAPQAQNPLDQKLMQKQQIDNAIKNQQAQYAHSNANIFTTIAIELIKANAKEGLSHDIEHEEYSNTVEVIITKSINLAENIRLKSDELTNELKDKAPIPQEVLEAKTKVDQDIKTLEDAMAKVQQGSTLTRIDRPAQPQ